MRKFLALTLAGIMMLSMTACGEKAKDTESNKPSSSQEAIESETKKEKKITKIENTATDSTPLEDKIVPFYTDEEYVYCFEKPFAEYVIVTYDDGTTENFAEALENGNATVEDLDEFEIFYLKELKNPTYANPEETEPEVEEETTTPTESEIEGEESDAEPTEGTENVEDEGDSETEEEKIEE